jgi:uncharacterized damage-inducible protein DinB
MSPAEARALTDHFVEALEAEHRSTVEVIGSVPERGRSYRPDALSRSAWELAGHIAYSELWFLDGILQGAFRYDPSAEVRWREAIGSLSDLVVQYTSGFRSRISGLRRLSDSEAAEEVDFLGMFARPRAALIGTSLLHTVHHRGQLAGYLRAAGSRVPPIYGPTAHEREPAAGS